MKNTILFVLSFLSLNLFSQENNFSLLGRWANGSSNCIKIENNIAYVGNGSSLTLLDITEPESPQEISHIVLPSMVNAVVVENDLAFIGTSWGGGLYIFDISDQENPLAVGELEVGGECYKMIYQNGFIYYLTNNGLLFINVITATSPELTGSVFITETPDFFINGNHAFFASKANGLSIYDISNHQTPARVGFIQNNYYIKSVSVKNNYAFVGEGSNLRVFDVSDVSSPQEAGVIQGNIKKLLIDNDNLYSVGDFGDLNIFDISNPASPALTGSLPIRYFTNPNEIALKDSALFIADGAKLEIVNVNDPGNITKMESYITASYFSDMIFDQEILYASDFINGLYIHNVSNDSNPVRTSFITPADEINFRSLTKKDNYIYLAGSSGIFVIDVDHLDSPEIVNKIDYVSVVNLKVQGNYLYVSAANNAKGLTIYDISDPSSPLEKGTLELASQAMAVSGDYAYVVSNSEDGFNIVDISDPMNPIKKSFSAVNSIYYYRDIFVSGNYVYTVGHGLNVTDISDPLSPETIGVTWEFDYGSSVKVVNDDAYVGHEDGITAIDISDKTNPVIAHGLKTPKSYTAKLCTNDQNKIYFNQVYNGTYVLRNDLPTKTKKPVQNTGIFLLQNYPNPFNDVTTINYYLPNQGNVYLSVYDVSGKEVDVLIDHFKSAGEHAILWKPENIESKEYFLRLMVDDKIVSSKKIIMN